MHRGWATFFVVSLGIFAGTISVKADESSTNYTTPKVIAIQNRDYLLSDEITVDGAYQPIDSFNRYFTYGASYTHFFNDYLAWEILNLNNASNNNTGLNQQLQTSFNVSAYPFNTLNYFGTTNLVYTPIFNKSLIINSTVARGETSFLIGGGLAKFDSGFVNMLDAGVIFRFLLSRQTSIKFDFRYNFYFNSTAKNNLCLGLGFAFNFGKPNSQADGAKPQTQDENDD